METYHDQVTSVNQPLAAGVANALALSCLLSPSCHLTIFLVCFTGIYLKEPMVHAVGGVCKYIMFAVVELLGLQTASLLQKAGCTGVQLRNRLTLVDSVTVYFVWQVHGNCTVNRKFLSVFTVY